MVSCARFLGREAPMARWPMHVQGFCGMDVVARGRGSDALVGGAGEWVARRALGQPQIGGHVGAWSAKIDVGFRPRHCPRGTSMGVDCLVDSQDGRFSGLGHLLNKRPFVVRCDGVGMPERRKVSCHVRNPDSKQRTWRTQATSKTAWFSTTTTGCGKSSNFFMSNQAKALRLSGPS